MENGAFALEGQILHFHKVKSNETNRFVDNLQICTLI